MPIYSIVLERTESIEILVESNEIDAAIEDAKELAEDLPWNEIRFEVPYTLEISDPNEDYWAGGEDGHWVTP